LIEISAAGPGAFISVIQSLSVLHPHISAFMPLPLSTVIQQHIQQWHQSAAAVVHLVQTAIALYSASEYQSQLYHTSKLTGEEWVWELIRGHPNRIYTELGVHLYVFVTLAIELRGMGYGDSRYGVTTEEQLAIFLYMCVTGLSVRHTGERFQRSNETIAR
jgi:hypothetical protein